MAHTRKVMKNGKWTGKWHAQIYLGRHPETGKPKFLPKTFSREKEMKDWVTKMEGQKNDGLVGPTTTKVPFGTYLTTVWLPSYATQVRSIYNIQKTLEKWILRPQPNTPFLGRIPLSKLTVEHLDHLYVAMQAHGMGARNIAYVHGLLKRALKFARKKHQIAHNPADDATVPKPDVQAEI